MCAGAVTLSAHAWVILQMVAEGRTSGQIADALCVSVPTVAKHRRHILEKTGPHSGAKLTMLAMREGVTALDS